MTESGLIQRLCKLKRHSWRYRRAVMVGLVVVALLVLLGESGCLSGQPRQVPAPVIVQPYQRFTPIAYGQGFLSFPYWAFDTKTGQLCKTWDWQSNSGASEKSREMGDRSKLSGLDAAGSGTSTCEALWRQYPDK